MCPHIEAAPSHSAQPHSIERLSRAARRAVQAQDWATVERCARMIIDTRPDTAEGHFLAGLVAKAARRPKHARAAFKRALGIDARRYDAAVELANQFSIARRNAEAAALLRSYAAALDNSPMYLDMAGTVFNDIGLAAEAWPLYVRANELQPGVDLFRANLAACAVYLGKIDVAATLYRELLAANPQHQRNHYHLSRLATATDSGHIGQMLELLQATQRPPAHNVFLYYAIGKEYEDLERWDDAFAFYRRAGDAVCSVARYDVAQDVGLIDTIIGRCSASWLGRQARQATRRSSARTPVFIVGLPRTGTTLTERIVASHSRVASLGETQFLQMVMRRESGVVSTDPMNAAMVKALSDGNLAPVAAGYLDAVAYRLGEEPFFIDKLPLNILHLGIIAKAWPDARIILLSRHPLDACLAMYKQVFTWAYKFSYSLDTLGLYYKAYDRLVRHWRDVLGERLIEVQYEQLVRAPERQIRTLLERLGLEFEPACLAFQNNPAASATASSVQVRRKIYTGSVNKWQHFAHPLAPLRKALEDAQIDVSPA